MQTCAYHPDRPAVDRCAECAREICSECRTEVAGKPVCAQCVETIRARVAAEMDAGGQTQGGYQAPVYGMGAGATAAPPMTHVHPVAQEPPSPARLLMGIIAGTLVGVVGAFILKTIVYYAHFSISYFNIILGGAVGVAVMAGSGRKGPLTAALSAVLAFAAMMLADYMLFTSLAADRFGSQVSLGTLPLSLFLELQKAQSPMHWICVAIGVWAAFSLSMQKNAAE